MSKQSKIMLQVKKCVKCGCIVFVKNGKYSRCLDCKKEFSKRWRENNIKKVKLQEKIYRDSHKEQAKIRIKKWGQDNPEKRNLTVRKWQKKNPEAMRIIDHNKRARKKIAGGTLSKGLAKKLFVLQKGKCACCGKSLGDNYHLDHIMPIALGGANEDWNIQLLTQRCNNQKYAKHPVDFMREKGFLI